MRFSKLRPLAAPLAAGGSMLLAFAFIQGCGNDMPTGPTGGPVAGAQDMHCIADDGGMITQATSQASCQATPDAGPPGTPDADQTMSDYGATMNNQAGADDDCKYTVSWTSTPIYENYDVHFTITVKTTVDNQPATGADPQAEVFLNDMHGAPPTNQLSAETSPGVYDIGPVRFDLPGKWTVRFHMYGSCKDLVATSPHGHAAFFVDVP
jgi:hypothetical protein